ncbi:MAG: hypothetical protein P1U58_15330 [Verrucomicrobiales bacterium]|nr:hypothetical protein [Verrucomicrobiales bacterium]
MISKTIKSPSGRIRGKLRERGSIRMGPALFSLELQPFDFSNRLFLMRYLWSNDSKYLAIVEALTAADSERPYTEILIIDYANDREFSVPNVDGRRVTLGRFDGKRFLYSKSGGGYFEIEFESLSRWRSIPRENEG